MTSILNSLREKWDLDERGGQDLDRHLAIFFGHTQEWFLGWDIGGKRQLVLVTHKSSHIPSLPSSRYVQISETQLESKLFHLYITLLDDSVYEVFLKLCEDLIQQVKDVKDTSLAQKIVLDRFDLWRKMLEKKSISVEDQKGLLGELLLFQDLLKEGVSAVDIVNAWTGPEYTEQDFVFADRWYEVKAVSSGSMVVTISSVGQLDHPDQGWLCVYRLDKSKGESADTISVKKIINKIRTQYLMNDSSALGLFEDKLYQFGYMVFTVDDDFEFSYTYSSRYEVTENFPKLPRDVKRQEMQSIKYNLILSSLEPWRVM